MAKFAATFGQRYKHEEHPRLPGIHERSVLIVEAPTEVHARRALNIATTGDATAIGKYAFIYDYDHDFELQVETYELKILPYQIRPSTRGDREYEYVGYDLEAPQGTEIIIGCICHTNLKEALNGSSGSATG